MSALVGVSLPQAPPDDNESIDDEEAASPPPVGPSPPSGPSLHEASSSTTVLVLHSTTLPHRLPKRHQQEAFRILDSLRIPYTALDGADADCRNARDDLFLLSGRHAVYPQFFVIRNNVHVEFWGDFDKLQQAHERHSLVEELLCDASASDDGNIPKGNEGDETEAVDFEASRKNSAVNDSCAKESSQLAEEMTQSSSSEEDMELLQLDSSAEAEDPTADVSFTNTDATQRLALDGTAPSDVPVGSAATNQTVSEGGALGSASRSVGTSRDASSTGTPTTLAQPIETNVRRSDPPASEITIYGATSFVAQNHVLPYLMQVSLHLPRVLRVTLAGRSPSKLEALLKEASRKMECLVTMHPHASGACRFDTLVAEGSDEAALLGMAHRTLCVLNCAGPFRRYSSLVVAACARAGTDYVDITGEISWAGEMRQRYSDLARASGARIVSFCGFDSVPSDLAVFAAVEAMRAARRKKEPNHTVEIERAMVWHHCIGMANGGTVHTALDMPISLDNLLQPVPYLLEDPLVLTHPSIRYDSKMQSIRRQLALGEWWNQLPTFDTVFRLGMSIPFFMAIVNAKVVHASSIALKYGPNFSYRERFLPVGFSFTSHLGPLSVIPAIFTHVILMFCFAILKLPILGYHLASWLAPPGTGMSNEACQRGRAEVYAVVESAKDSLGCSDRASCTLKFNGDPGNWVTAQCVVESALCLVLDKKQLPPRSDDGFGTPAELLGHALLARLRSSSVRPVKVHTSIRQNMTGKEWSMY